LDCEPRAVIIPSWELFDCCHHGFQAIVELYIEKGGTVVILIGNYPSVNTLLNIVKFLRSIGPPWEIGEQSSEMVWVNRAGVSDSYEYVPPFIKMNAYHLRYVSEDCWYYRFPFDKD
jgi:hypothetical protein